MTQIASGELSLLVVANDVARMVPLAGDRTTIIGRGTTASVVLEDASLSRQHAAFHSHGGALAVEDLASSNGTWLGGERLAPHARRGLAIGDTLRLGTVLAIVQRRGGSVADRLRPAGLATGDALIERLASSSLSVLILGETGAGKERMADRLHALGPRRDRPLVKLNCGGLSPGVLDSELFGHERGAFTGAIKDKPGLVESADGGTLFLDEVGDAPRDVQVKLLRVLEARETQRIGALRPRAVDVRFLAATHGDPQALIASGALRQDLYYRIAGFTLTIPPLRDRLGELGELARALLPDRPLTPDALVRLRTHAWPGNVRELSNALARAAVLSDATAIDAAAIDVALSDSSAPDPERARILDALARCGGNQTLAAAQLGISRRTLVYRLQAWGLTKSRRGS